MALFGVAVGAQALGPAPAAAMINQGDVGVCQPLSGLGGGLGWNFTTGQSCFLGQGSGGSGNGASGNDEIIGEPIEVEGDAPLTDCALPEEERRNCPVTEPPEDDAPQPEEDVLPPQQGLGFFPGKNSTEALREEKRRRLAECLELQRVGKVWRSYWIERAQARIQKLEERIRVIHEKWQEEGLDEWEFSEMRRANRDISDLRREIRRVLTARVAWDTKKCAALISPPPGGELPDPNP